MSEESRDTSKDPCFEHIDKRLDEALEESFPASDPPAVSLSDDPPRQAEAEAEREGDAGAAPRKRTIIKRVLAGGALAAAGVFVTRMFLRRSPKRRIH